MASWRVIEAPLDSSGTSRGEERAPEALVEAGLLERLGADRVKSRAYIRGARRDPVTGVINPQGIRHASRAIATAVRGALAPERRALVVGGDCAILLGVFSALRRGTRLWFLDGHPDFLDGKSSPTGEVADMDLAALTGHGPPDLLGIGEPLVQPEDVTLLGHRPDHLDQETADENARLDPAITALTVIQIRDRGVQKVAHELSAIDPSRETWLHIDLDVLDVEVLPAVSYGRPMGLTWDEFIALARPLARQEGVVGISLADFNPDLDPAGEHARTVVRSLEAVLS